MVRFFVEKILKDLYLLRLDDDETKYFESIWEIPEGVTYNAYVLTTEHGAVMFDAWKSRYSEILIEALRSIVDPKDVKALVIHHMEPDHSGSIPFLLKHISKDVEVLGHHYSNILLKSFYNIDVKFRPLKDLEHYELYGRKMVFIHTPWLHWPETSMTYMEDGGVLFSGDAFGGFSIPKSIFDDDVHEEYMVHVKKYIATVIGHYREKILDAIKKIKSMNLDIKVIAPLHGLIWRRDVSKIINYYESCANAIATRGKILLIYGSMYGVVRDAIEYIIQKFSERGYTIKEYRFTDLERGSISDLVGDALDAEMLIIGCSTYEGDALPTVKYVVEILAKKVASRKPVIIISSFGWQGVAGKSLSEILKAAGFDVKGIVEARGLIDRGLLDSVC